jgi:hypothetical protein
MQKPEPSQGRTVNLLVTPSLTVRLLHKAAPLTKKGGPETAKVTG